MKAVFGCAQFLLLVVVLPGLWLFGVLGLKGFLFWEFIVWWFFPFQTDVDDIADKIRDESFTRNAKQQ